MKILIALSILLASSLSFAVERKVPIATQDGKVKIINGSAHPMTYTINCFDKSSGAAIVTETHTLQPKREREYNGGDDICSASAELRKNIGTGPGVLCKMPSQIAYSARATACGSNAHVCQFTEVTDNSNMTVKEDDYYAYDPPPASWDRWDGKSWYTVADGTTTYKPSTYQSDYFQARMTATPGTVYDNVYAYYDIKNSNYYRGAACCANNAGYGSCEVTVPASNHPDGFLQSPQFKGGKSF